MSTNRDRAIARESHELAERALHLRRLSRNHPEISGKLHEAHGLLDTAGQLADEGIEAAESVLADLTACSSETLRVRAVTDDNAICELARREELPVAA